MTDLPAQPDLPSAADLRATIHRVFGFHDFRPNQEEIVHAILGGRDVFAVMPTGGGKSLCYQLPACVLPGTCVVISPLISLMKDQVDAACANGLAAAYLNSTLDGAQRAAVLSRLRGGALDLLYVSPERFAMDHFLSVLRDVRLCLFAVDEAHCISEWGHQFRPDYLELSRIVAEFPGVPVAAFTATATQPVQEDIVGKLALREPLVVRASFNRPNLFYQVLPKANVRQQMLRFLEARKGESGIIYRTTRRSVEETAEYLRSHGVPAAAYHAGLSDDERHRVQEAFNRDQTPVVVATIAFGMGIDKSNVRFVLHGDLPKNMESYYQETGRAGRDGAPAHCLLYFGAGDIPKIRYFIDQIEDDTERQVATWKLNQMAAYASACACRRRQMLGYFGETWEAGNCGACDVCAGDVERVEATTEAQMVLSAIVRTGERFGAAHVVDVVAGAETQKIRQFGHDRVKTYGVGADRPKGYWRRIVDDLLAQGCVVQDPEYKGLRLTPRGREVLFGRETFHVIKTTPRKRRRRPVPDADFDEGLFEQLRQVRRRLAEAKNVPPYIIFSDKTLHEMAGRFPTSRQEMAAITGVGERKLEWYGEEFLAAIRSYSGTPNGG